MVFAKTDIGKAREINQDYYYVSKENSIPKLYILADGMGGYNGGEIASRLATSSVKSYIESNFNEIEHTKENIADLIKNAIEYANMVVYEKSKENKELEGMGTTLEVCLIYNNRVFIGHVGDSRIYRIRKEVIRKLTKDHSYVQKLVEDKKITREEAKFASQILKDSKNAYNKQFNKDEFSTDAAKILNAAEHSAKDLDEAASDAIYNMTE